MFEFALAFIQNLKPAISIALVLLLLISLLSGFMGMVMNSSPIDDSDRHVLTAWKRVHSSKRFWAAVLAGIVVFCMPSIGDLWEVRINLIKYQLASPENVKAGAETIQRIGKELEEKYLK